MDLDQRTREVSREEYDKVKRRADIMKKRMASFAMAIKSSENIPITLSESSFAGSPRKVASGKYVVAAFKESWLGLT